MATNGFTDNLIKQLAMSKIASYKKTGSLSGILGGALLFAPLGALCGLNAGSQAVYSNRANPEGVDPRDLDYKRNMIGFSLLGGLTGAIGGGFKGYLASEMLPVFKANLAKRFSV